MEIFKCGSVSPVGKVEPAKPVWLRLLHLSHRKKFNTDFEVNPIDCEGCGVCVYFCPEKAINFPINTCGDWFISDTRVGPMVHAHLGIAEEKGLMCLGRIPFDPVFTEAMVQAQTVFEYNKGNEITKKETRVPPPHEPGVLPAWLHKLGAGVIIAGGMGGRALSLFEYNGIKVVTGASAGEPEELVSSYLDDTLAAGANVCDH